MAERVSLLTRINNFLVGPNASAIENLVTYLVAVVSMVAVGAMFSFADEFAFWKLLVLLVVAFDLFGGATANATNAARRLWHRPGVSKRSFVTFTAAHVHPILMGFIFEGFDLVPGIVGYVAVLVSVLFVLAVPKDVVRPTAYGACALSILLVTAIGGVAWYLAWFLPVLFLKLTLAHALPDGAQSQQD